MAELTFKSAGVSTREIDLSGPSQVRPSGTPAGIIGTANGGPAFVPITVATYGDFVARFGATDGEKFGPLAMNEWMRNSQAGTYVRMLGVGDGKKRLATGIVTSAGFVVGERLPQANGNIGANPECGSVAGYSGSLGRTYLLGCFMSQSAAQTNDVAYKGLFKQSGMRGGAPGTSDGLSAPAGGGTRVGLHLDGDAFPKSAVPILRGVVMTPSGVMMSLSSSAAFPGGNAPRPEGRGSAGVFVSGALAGVATTAHGYQGQAVQARADQGWAVGDVNLANSGQQFCIFLNGLKADGGYNNVITASFDPKSPSYFANVLNTDPLKVEEAGHVLYAHWNVYPQYAVVTGSGLTIPNSSYYTGGTVNTDKGTLQVGQAAFCVTASAGRNTSSATVPDFEGYQDRFTHASSPWVTSQNFGGKAKNLFKLHVLDDGVAGNRKFKVSIENINKPTNTAAADQYGTFDLVLRDFYDNDRNPVAIEKFVKVSLNPQSERYIGRLVGDRNIYYDFDKNEGSQKLVVEGLYPNMSRNIRVELSDEVSDGRIDATALPVGFRGPKHLVTSGSSIVQAIRAFNKSAKDSAGKRRRSRWHGT